MQTSQKVFIDTSLFIAFIDRSDRNHLASIALFEFLARQKYKLFTSSLVVSQTFTIAENRMGSTISTDFLQAVLESSIHILYPQESDYLAVFRYLRVNPKRDSSFTEIVNSHLMDKQGIGAALTFDFWHNLFGTKISSLLNP
jgi:predicted nucleic acid-binding protein